MKILFNNVLVKIDPVDQITLSSGFKLFIDNRFEEQKNAPQSGIVVQLPERLVFSHDPQINSLEYDVDNEIQVGDRVIFHYLAEENARKQGLVFDNDCIPVIYDRIFAVIRGEEIIPLNGIVLVAPESEIIQSNIIIPDSYNKTMKSFGTVIAAGRPHRQRRFRTYSPPPLPFSLSKEGFSISEGYCKTGDKVFFHRINAIPLQHNAEMHGAISKKLIYRMNHDDIEVVVTEPELITKLMYS